MKKTIQELTSYSPGDIISLSDVQTLVDFNQDEVDFEIENVKKYTSPDGNFEYTGYVATNEDENVYMIIVKTSGDDYEIYVYYLEAEGKLYKADDGEEDCPFWAVFDENQDDLLESIHVSVTFDENDVREIDWDKQFVVNGVACSESDSNIEGICTLGEYYTNDDMSGNNYCLIDLKGEPDDGYIEIWYGCKIEDHEIQFHRTEED